MRNQLRRHEDELRELQAFRRAPAATLFALALAYAPSAMAHKTSYAYLNAIFAPGVSGKLELAVRDFDAAFFDFAFGPGDGGGKVNLAQLHRREQEIAGLLLNKFSIGPPGTACSLKPLAIALDSRGSEPYMIVPFSGVCEPGGELQVAYDLMFDIDAEHRALVDIRRDSDVYTGVMTPETRVLHFGASTKNLADTLLAHIRQGAHHIWIGTDHILFLVSLLLPAVLIRMKHKWLPVNGFAGAFWSTAKVVTAFTLAHSITLSVAAFGIVELPSRCVECVIAASVAVAAMNNLYPAVTHRLWIVAFLFGLIHGFGFASVLNEFGLPPDRKLAALLAFNIGVEIGQLAIVAAVLPALFLARHTIAYSRIAMPAGSLIIAMIAIVWFVERATGVTYFVG
ncbi:MAG: HupE/UreJ family protein [Beijerinckiaceae bacterium]|nr:HupE/UreJ family protein [Beijerinckiaceae bacterium]